MNPNLLSQLLGTASKILSNLPATSEGQFKGSKDSSTVNLNDLFQGKLGKKSEAFQFALNKAFLEEEELRIEQKRLRKEIFCHSDIIAQLGHPVELSLEKIKEGFVATNSLGKSMKMVDESDLGVLLYKEYLLNIICNVKKATASSGGTAAYQKLYDPEIYKTNTLWKITLEGM